MMLIVGIDQKQLKRLSDALSGNALQIRINVATAINATAKQVTIQAARALKTEMNVPVKVLKKTIKQKSIARKDNLTARVGLWGGYPIPLKYFKPKDTKPKKGAKGKKAAKGTGVYYYAKKGGQKIILPDAFIAKQYGGNVFRRKTKDRAPLEKLTGPSPGDFFESSGARVIAIKTAHETFPKELLKRIRFVLLKQSGGLRGKQK
jgi:hypothetical protein